MCVFSYFYESFEPIIINDEICPIFQSEISRQNDILKPNAFEIDVNATGDCAKWNSSNKITFMTFVFRASEICRWVERGNSKCVESREKKSSR